MGFMKRIFTVFLITILTLTMVSAGTVLADNSSCYNEENVASKAEGLIATGLISHDIGADKCNTYVTNSELACVIADMLGFSRIGGFGSEIPYADVSTDASYYAKVKFAYSNGYLPNANMFYPDMNAVSDDAVESLVKMLGYGEICQSYGGAWNCAARIGLIKGSVPSQNSYFKWYQLIELIHNSLDINVMNETGYANGDIIYAVQKDSGILGKYHNLYEFEGVVLANEYTSIEIGAKEASEGFVKVGSELFKTGETDIKSLLGYNVTGYVREEDGKYTVVYAQAYDNKTVTVNAQNLLTDSDEWSAANIMYEDEKGNEKSIRLSRDTKVVYNGKLFADAVANDYKIISGNITAINNDDDSVYDVLNITSYKNIIVQSYDSFDNKIYCKTGFVVDIDESRVSVDLRNFADEPYDLKYIGQNAIMSLAISKDSKLVSGYAMRSKASGSVSEIKSNGNDVESIVLGGDSYKISEQWKTMNYLEKPEIKIGKRYLCYLDFNGEIAHVIDKSGSECEYGYLYKFGKTSGLDATERFRIFTQDGEWGEFNASDKIKINGIKAENDSDFNVLKNQDGSTKEQLIKFFTDADENINSIYTNDRSVTEEPTDYFRDEFVYNGSVSGKYRSNCSMFGLEYTITGKSKIFYLPEIIVDGVPVKMLIILISF